jgi:hypothetical protein
LSQNGYVVVVVVVVVVIHISIHTAWHLLEAARRELEKGSEGNLAPPSVFFKTGCF